MFKQKIKRGALIFLIMFLIVGFYLQYGRDMDVYNSYVFSVGSHNEQNLKIVANKLWIKDKRKYADEILERCRNNSFNSIDFCYDWYVPNSLYVEVYLSKYHVVFDKIEMEFKYYPQNNDDSISNIIMSKEKYKLELVNDSKN